MSSVWWVRNSCTEEADVYYQGSDLPQPFFALSTSFFPTGWSDSLSLWLLHNTAQTPRLLWAAQKKHQGLFSFVHPFLSPSQSAESIR